MYSKVKDLLKLSQSISENELVKICNEYYWIYSEIYSTSNNEEIKKIALNKLNSLADAMKAEGVDVNPSVLVNSKTPKNDISFVETLFNNYRDENNSGFNKDEINREITKLPDCARKYYLQAVLVYVSEAKNVSTYNRIAELIGKALSLEPTNFVYKQILNDIQKAIDNYESDLNAWRRAEQERIDHERRVETTKKVASGVGTVLLAVLGAIGAAIAGLFACLCECLDGC